MDNLTGSMKDLAFATSPREFDLSYSTTIEEIMEKLAARRAAFQMPFQPLAFPEGRHARPYPAGHYRGQDVGWWHAH